MKKRIYSKLLGLNFIIWTSFYFDERIHCIKGNKLQSFENMYLLEWLYIYPVLMYHMLRHVIRYLLVYHKVLISRQFFLHTKARYIICYTSHTQSYAIIYLLSPFFFALIDYSRRWQCGIWTMWDVHFHASKRLFISYWRWR